MRPMRQAGYRPAASVAKNASASAVTTLVTASLAAVFDYRSLVGFSNVTVVFQYAITCLAVPVLRRRETSPAAQATTISRSGRLRSVVPSHAHQSGIGFAKSISESQPAGNTG